MIIKPGLCALLLFLLPWQSAVGALKCFPQAIPFVDFAFFQNVPLQPGACVQTNYDAGNHPGVYCFDNTLQIDPPAANLYWQLDNLWLVDILSRTSIVFDTGFEGLFARMGNSSGGIIIKNISNPPVTLFVNCQFTF